VKIESAFEVPASPERAWELLMDVPRVIPCMPGTELTEAVDDANWKAKMTVKLGPMSFAFATDVKREEADEAARRARLSARARETRGRGGGQATIESTLVPLGSGTRVEIVTDLTLSGALAQYGRGMVADVSNRLVGQFAECLRNELTAEPAGAATGAAAEEEPASPAQAAAPKPISALSLAAAAARDRLRALLQRLRGKERPHGN
jgi:uncharacterized protein